MLHYLRLFGRPGFDGDSAQNPGQAVPRHSRPVLLKMSIWKSTGGEAHHRFLRVAQSRKPRRVQKLPEPQGKATMSSTGGGGRGKAKPATKSVSRSSKAGLQFPVGAVSRVTSRPASTRSMSAPVHPSTSPPSSSTSLLR
jgi:hypothetical protein